VKTAYDGSDMTGLGSFHDSTSKSAQYHKGRSVIQLLAKHGIETRPWPWGILKPEMKKT